MLISCPPIKNMYTFVLVDPEQLCQPWESVNDEAKAKFLLSKIVQTLAKIRQTQNINVKFYTIYSFL